MEKLIITAEQEDKLKTFKQVGATLESFVINGVNSFYKPLEIFTPEQFALLLCGWYEVKQPFKVGYWVYDKGLYLYRKVAKHNYLSDRFVYVEAVLNAPDTFEEIEEPWKIMLLELGRKTPDFKPGDVIVTHQDVYVAGYHDHDDIVLLFEENLVIRFCPEEHSIEV